MYIWKLSVVDFTSPNWEMSTCKGNIIIRAASETQARLIATRDFTIVDRRILGGGSLHSPWENIHDTACERLEDSHYSRRGEAGVLEITQPAAMPHQSERQMLPSVFNVAAFARTPAAVKKAH